MFPFFFFRRKKSIAHELLKCGKIDTTVNGIERKIKLTCYFSMWTIQKEGPGCRKVFEAEFWEAIITFFLEYGKKKEKWQ